MWTLQKSSGFTGGPRPSCQVRMSMATRCVWSSPPDSLPLDYFTVFHKEGIDFSRRKKTNNVLSLLLVKFWRKQLSKISGANVTILVSTSTIKFKYYQV